MVKESCDWVVTVLNTRPIIEEDDSVELVSLDFRHEDLLGAVVLAYDYILQQVFG
jgi:hypothetical protein